MILLHLEASPKARGTEENPTLLLGALALLEFQLGKELSARGKTIPRSLLSLAHKKFKCMLFSA